MLNEVLTGQAKVPGDGGPYRDASAPVGQPASFQLSREPIEAMREHEARETRRRWILGSIVAFIVLLALGILRLGMLHAQQEDQCRSAGGHSYECLPR